MLMQYLLVLGLALVLKDTFVMNVLLIKYYRVICIPHDWKRSRSFGHEFVKRRCSH